MSRRILILSWIFATAINLPVPLQLGRAVNSKWVLSGACDLGMLAGIGVFLFAGFWFCRSHPRLMWRLVIGSPVTAASQVMPGGQLGAGIAAWLCMACLLPDALGDNPVISVARVMGLTFLTGLFLVVPALLTGALIGAIFPQVVDPRD